MRLRERGCGLAVAGEVAAVLGFGVVAPLVGGVLVVPDVTDPTSPDSLGSPLTGFDTSVLSVAFSPDSHTLAAGSGGGTLRLWALR